MRKIINISFPEEINKNLERAVKENSFNSKSEFFRYLFRRWEEERAIEEIERSKGEVRDGRAKELKSLKDLR